MRLRLLYAASLAAALAAGACTCKTATDTPAPDTDKGYDKVYTGVLPAADADGVRYTLLLDYDDNTGGDYEMVQTYFATDSTGVCDIATFATEGDFTTGKTAAGTDYIKLSGDGAGELYFVAATDSTMVMTDASLTPVATPGMNYTLKAAK